MGVSLITILPLFDIMKTRLQARREQTTLLVASPGANPPRRVAVPRQSTAQLRTSEVGGSQMANGADGASLLNNTASYTLRQCKTPTDRSTANSRRKNNADNNRNTVNPPDKTNINRSTARGKIVKRIQKNRTKTTPTKCGRCETCKMFVTNNKFYSTIKGKVYEA